MTESRRRRMHAEHEWKRSGVAARRQQREWKHFGDGRPHELSLAQRGTSAEREQRTAALAHEISEHAQLVAREERRFDAAEYDRAVLEQLFALRGKSAHQLEAVPHTEAEILLLCAAHEPDDLDAAVRCHCTAEE